MHQAKVRRIYKEDSVLSSSPRKQFIMLYDNLIVDLDRAEMAFRVRDLYGIHEALRHAQDILHLVMSSLRLDLWDGARNLKELYGYALSQLIQANLYKDIKYLREAENVLRPLGEAWAQADKALDAEEAAASGVA
ncbi:flagellar protein FliS [Ferrithrix thermotolerans DSM 19514]|jgi:flagellar protein FliS|uniref:Flagellar protein FliS n=1 Tax=Ferrithrix thermotolerans DSM 19514 TaxID=1121881 RepID=A0A1M4WAT3_9ACTN|nr:flagellar export chaperone FliS [Ferrithrix thermotolerans]SHE78193.1 flagellar protein FliS [Ferrithrix thermotolerans DSM 19514]